MTGEPRPSHQERLRLRQQQAVQVRQLSHALPGGQMISLELAAGRLIPLRSRRRWSSLGRYTELLFRIEPREPLTDETRLWYEAAFRLRTRSFGSAVDVVCAFWPQLLGKAPNRYREVSEVVDTATDARYGVSAAAQFGPVVLVAAVLAVAALFGILKLTS